MVVDAIEKQLVSEPTKESRAKVKKMTQPFWSQYRLRVGEYRIYYDVDEKGRAVLVLRVYEKRPGRDPGLPHERWTPS
jgi:mRNA-degrading endonuclease RelE of RelBE toxin-antitoxin system